jgi:hypothetical protein
LFAVFVDYADFAGANPIVDANKGLGCSFVESDGTPPLRFPAGSSLSLTMPPPGSAHD